ncbi:hypothetical protein MBLNU230_g2758t1 [Neophaeotheca triangularis]
MGASLAEGLTSYDGNGFRRDLKRLFDENGWRTDMVGSQQVGNMTDNDEEAYPGVTVEDFNNESSNSGAYDLDPHVMIVLVGTNDCWFRDAQDDSNPDEREQAGIEAADRFGSILLPTMKENAPDALILAAQLVRNSDDWANRCVVGFNERLPEIVKEAADGGQNVRILDMYSVVPEDEMHEDGTHPTDRGYSLMAEAWYDGINNATQELCGTQRQVVDNNATETEEGGERASADDASSSSSSSSPSPSGSTSAATASSSSDAESSESAATAVGALNVLGLVAALAVGFWHL